MNCKLISVHLKQVPFSLHRLCFFRTCLALLSSPLQAQASQEHTPALPPSLQLLHYSRPVQGVESPGAEIRAHGCAARGPEKLEGQEVPTQPGRPLGRWSLQAEPSWCCWRLLFRRENSPTPGVTQHPFGLLCELGMDNRCFRSSAHSEPSPGKTRLQRTLGSHRLCLRVKVAKFSQFKALSESQGCSQGT